MQRLLFIVSCIRAARERAFYLSNSVLKRPCVNLVSALISCLARKDTTGDGCVVVLGEVVLVDLNLICTVQSQTTVTIKQFTNNIVTDPVTGQCCDDCKPNCNEEINFLFVSSPFFSGGSTRLPVLYPTAK